MAQPEELRPVRPGRFATRVRAPWGSMVPAEMLVASRAGWADRPEARDPRWVAFAVGPAVVALRLVGEWGAERGFGSVGDEREAPDARERAEESRRGEGE
jgi:hypothetical protein